MRTFILLALLLSAATACGDDGGDGINSQEVITTVTLTFTPAGGGTAVVAEFDDPDGDGGGAPTIDPINLTAGTYTTTVGFQNRLEDPAEEITDEVRDEADEHQVFFTGAAVNGPASDEPGAALTHSYTDTDANGLPIGLANAVVAVAGTGQLAVTLRHLPPVNDVAVKTTNLAEQVKTGGFAAIGGDTDVQVNFDVTVP